MRQFASDDKEAASAKENLWSQDENGNWRIDPEKDALRMANHTRVYHTKPTYQTVLDAVTKQFHQVRELFNLHQKQSQGQMQIFSKMMN